MQNQAHRLERLIYKGLRCHPDSNRGLKVLQTVTRLCSFAVYLCIIKFSPKYNGFGYIFVRIWYVQITEYTLLFTLDLYPNTQSRWNYYGCEHFWNA